MCDDGEDNDDDGYADCKDLDCDGCKHAYEPHEIAICGGETECYNDWTKPLDWDTADKKEFFCETYNYGPYKSYYVESYEEAALDCCIGLQLDKGVYNSASYKKLFMSPDASTPIKFYDCVSIEDCSNGLDEDGDELVDCADEDCDC